MFTRFEIIWTIIIIICSVLFTSCLPTSTTDIPGTPYTPSVFTATIIAPIAPIDTINSFMTGKGENDSWFCEFYAYKVRILYNHRKDSMIIKSDFSWDLRNPSVILNPLEMKEPDGSFSLEILPESCDGNEESPERKIQIRIGKKELNGCVIKTKKD